MRRQWLMNFAAVLSLLLCAATAGLWARSYWRVDLVGRDGPETADHWQRGGSASSVAGVLAVEWWIRQNEPTQSATATGWAYESWPLRSTPARTWGSFSYDATSWDSARPTSDGRAAPARMTYMHRVGVPHWFILLLFGSAGALGLVREARRRRTNARLRQNRCAACGYDLRATPGRCPECGAPPRGTTAQGNRI